MVKKNTLLLLPCKGFKARIPLKQCSDIPPSGAGVGRDYKRSQQIHAHHIIGTSCKVSTYYEDAKSLTVIMQPGSPPPSAEFGFTKTARPPSRRLATNIRGRSHHHRIAIAITGSSIISISIVCKYINRPRSKQNWDQEKG